MCGVCSSRTLPVIPIEYVDNKNGSKESYNSSIESYYSNGQVSYVDLTIPQTCPECG